MSLDIDNTKVDDDQLNLYLNPVENLVLMRICCDGGATKSTIEGDLKSLLSQKFSSTHLKGEIDSTTHRLLLLGYIQKSRGHFLSTKLGLKNCENFLGLSFAQVPTWGQLRDIGIIRKIFGLTGNFNSCKELLGDPFFLCALILKKKYNLTFHLNISKEDLCQQLALKSLERAFQAEGKNFIKKKLRLPQKLARLFAGYLSDGNKEFSNYKSLFIALAAEATGARKLSLNAIKYSVIIKFIDELLSNYDPKTHKSSSRSRKQSFNVRALNKSNHAILQNFDSGGKNLPKLEDFVAAVLNIARQTAQGWGGSRKIFISRIWDALSKDWSGRGFSERDFKRMLADAHRRGDLLLSNADLKSDEMLHDIERSATPDRNTVWHYVRIED